MAVSNDKIRVQVSFKKDILEWLDNYCDSVGITRSNFVSYAVAMELLRSDVLGEGEHCDL